MHRRSFLVGLVAFIAVSILSGCFRPINPTIETGSITLSLASGAKTVQPPLASITVTSYTVEGSSPSGATVPLTPQTSSTFTISDLIAGAWTFTINGLDASGNNIATGSVNVTIIPAETVSGEVQLSPLSAGGATGTFTLAATWVAPLSITSIGGTITPLGGSAQPFAATIDGSSASYANTTLPVGSYMLLVNATEAGGGSFQAIYALRIYKDLVSPLVLSLTASDFTPIVAAPIPSPGAGTYSSTQTVTITSATEGASIRYTIDGTTPSETEGTVYSSPLSVSSSKTIKAIAYMTGMRTSSVTSATYVITGAAGMNVTDPWIPTISFSGQAASIIYGSSMTVTASVSPVPDNYTWYLDGQVIAYATGSSVTLGSTALIGSHLVALVVSKGTCLASRELTFSVTAPLTTTTTTISSYTVTYHGNGSTEGLVPIEVERHSEGSLVTVLAPGTLKKAKHMFDFWNTKADGSGYIYTSGSVFPMPSNDLVLYAKWQEFIPLVNIPGGSFLMGSPSGVGFNSEHPQHQVTISNLLISKYEIIQEEYSIVTKQIPSMFSGYRIPVERVTWYDAVEFCNTLSSMEGLETVYTITERGPENGYPILSARVIMDISKNGYRLPTEAEWEFIARGGNGSPGNYIYSGSNEIDTVAWYGKDQSTMNVGLLMPNSLGVYDMSGNVWEWCWDWFTAYSDNAQTDPTGEIDGEYRVLRGGGYANNAEFCTSTIRNTYQPAYRSGIAGFRVVRRP